MSIAVKGIGATAALALSLAFASGVADAGTPGHHGHHKHPANHGAAVSAVAKSDATSGEEHGDAVSAVARANAGKAASTSNGSGESAVASTQGVKISALAQATTGSGRGDTISDAAQMHGATVRAAARAK